MKEVYYVYNNEAIASCIFMYFLKKVDSIDIARFSLILPFLLDDRTVNYLSKHNLDIEEMIGNNSRIFISFNKRYISLLPTTINSLKMLFDGNQINIKNNILSTSEADFIIDDNFIGNRFNRIKQAVPNLIQATEKHSTKELYKILRIQL